MFDNLSDRFQNIFKKISGNSTITESNIKDALREVKLALLEADVNFTVTKEIVNNIKEKALGQEVIVGVNPKQQFIKIVEDELKSALGGTNTQLNKSSKNIYMLVGLQGAGKTTFAGKISNYLKKENKKVLLVGADTYRPAAKKQLEVLSKQIGVDYYTDLESDNPEEIVKTALSMKKGYDYIIIDTAGRLQIDEKLMDELKNIKNILNPNEILLVVDGMTGQEAINISKSFNDSLDITGVVLTKLDGDTRGGAALSIKYATNKPIKFISEGEKMNDISEFHPERIASRILGMGDVVSFVEKAQQEISQKEAYDMEKRLKANKFDFEDFLKQYNMINKLGSLKGILKFMPGNFSNIDLNPVEDDLKKTASIVYSMTIKERRNPDLLKSHSRKERIAKGAGVQISDVNKTIKKYEEMKKMLKIFNNGGFSNFKL